MPHYMHHTECGVNLLIHEALRKVVPSMDGYAGTFHDLRFLVTAAKEKDDKVWVHASVSRRDRKTPTFEDLVTLRKYTMPPDAVAYQLFVPEDEYYHQAIKGQVDVLHLWCCADGRVTPDFRSEDGTI